MRTGWCYDYETLANCFVGVFRELSNPKNRKVFIINPWKNDYLLIYDFLKQCAIEKHSMYSFNGIEFDNQISQFIVDPKTFREYSSSIIPPYQAIYELAQHTINCGKNSNGLVTRYSKFKNPFRERDILKINNYDNPSKRTSLKWIQYGIDWENIQDMPISHDTFITEKNVPEIVKYCDNDVKSLMRKVIMDKDEILLRDTLSNHFNRNLLSASEPQIAKAIFGQALAKAMNISEYELSKTWTERSTIDLNEIILNYIDFKDPILKKTLDHFKSLKLDANNLKGSFKKEIRYKGVPISYGLGGIHGAKKGIHESTKTHVIMSFDVVSYYPNLAIKNRWHPEHLPCDIFVETYENNFYERRKYPKGNPLNYVYKIVLNSAYGLSNEKHGNFMKDPKFTMQITVNGQLLLTMLMEQLVEAIPGARPLMYNTDGGEILIDRKYLPIFYKICKDWEELTQLQLEYDEYHKLLIADVNNYIGVYAGKPIELEKAKALIAKNPIAKPLIKRKKDNTLLHYKTKEKGRFELEKPLHKNKSLTVVTQMVYNKLLHNIPIEKTMELNKNIMDYCVGVRTKGNNKLMLNYYDPFSGREVSQELQKTNRYYITRSDGPGGKLVRITDKQKARLESYSGHEHLLNVYDPSIPFEQYGIDPLYYIQKAQSELNNFVQLEIQNQNLFTHVNS